MKHYLSRVERRASSAALALYTRDDKVLVVKSDYKPYWSLPGGIIDQGETPLAAAIRETDEEAGITVTPQEVVFRLAVDRVSSITHTYQFVFESVVSEAQLRAYSIDNREIVAAEIVARQQIIDGDREYSESTRVWAAGKQGYFEQQLDI